MLEANIPSFVLFRLLSSVVKSSLSIFLKCMFMDSIKNCKPQQLVIYPYLNLRFSVHSGNVANERCAILLPNACYIDVYNPYVSFNTYIVLLLVILFCLQYYTVSALCSPIIHYLWIVFQYISLNYGFDIGLLLVESFYTNFLTGKRYNTQKLICLKHWTLWYYICIKITFI